MNIEEGISRSTAAVLVVGDEFMTGEVRESNSHLIASSLRKSGIPVRQIMVIENNVDVIAFMLRRLSAVHRYLFVTGGIGPRHTDVTMLAVAKAFGTGVQEHPALLRRITAAATPQTFTNYHWRMAYIPFGADLVHPPGTEVEEEERLMRQGYVLGAAPEDSNGNTKALTWQEMMRSWPVIKKNNCFLFPSQPELLKSRLQFILPSLASTEDMYSTKIVFLANKAFLAEHIAKAAMVYEAVTTYSYSQYAENVDSNEVVMRTVVLIESEEEQDQKAATMQLLESVPSSWVASVEHEYLLKGKAQTQSSE